MPRIVSVAGFVFVVLQMTGCGRDPEIPKFIAGKKEAHEVVKEQSAMPRIAPPEITATAELRWDEAVDGWREEQRKNAVARMAALEDRCLPALRATPRNQTSDPAEIAELKRDIPNLRGGIVAFSPVEPLLAVGGTREIEIWDLNKAGIKHILPYFIDVSGTMQFSPDGRWLATEGEFINVLRVWDVANGRAVLTLPDNEMSTSGVGFSTDGTLLLTTGVTRTGRNEKALLHHRELGTGKIVKEFVLMEGQEMPVHFTFAPSGDKMVGYSQLNLSGQIYVFRTSDGTLLRKLPCPNPYVDCVFSPDGWRVAIGSSNLSKNGKKCLVQDWNLKDGAVQDVWDGRRLIPPMAYSADANRLYFASHNGLQYWDIREKKSVEVSDFLVDRMAISHGGRFLCAKTRLFDLDFSRGKK